jgi:7-cyano-7-deazaguanine synthase
MKALAIVSGGMDSTVLTYDLVAKGYDVHLMSFNYGQRHKKELDYAKVTGGKLRLNHTIVDITHLTGLISKSTLTSDAPVPDGHYAEDNMRKTVVPNRNSIMLNIAAGYAVTMGANVLATAVHSGDHYIYPDCRPQFIDALQNLLLVANEGFIDEDFKVFAPYVQIPKDGICTIGNDLNVPWLDTWSCYKGGEIHCGSCGTCFERREAFELAGIEDPTDYLARPHYDDPR